MKIQIAIKSPLPPPPNRLQIDVGEEETLLGAQI